MLLKKTIIWTWRLTAPPLALIALGTITPAFAEASSQTVEVSIITCPDAVVYKTTATATIDGEGQQAGSLHLNHISSYQYSTILSLMAGHYRLYISDGFCSANVEFFVLSGHNRRISAFLTRQRVIYDSHVYLAGGLPIGGVTSGFLGDSTGKELFPVTIDGNAYYGEHLLDRSYLLILNFAEQDLQCRLPVSVGGIGSILNLTASDLVKCIGILLRPHGQAERFKPLWGNEIY